MKIYNFFETRIEELDSETCDRLLNQLVAAISSERCMDVNSLHLSILNLEKSAKEMK